MFGMVARLFNQPLEIGMSNLNDMNSMFTGATSFNQPLNNWNVSNVTNMSEMFSALEVINFNQPY